MNDMTRYAGLIDRYLDTCLDGLDTPDVLYDAMKYSLCSGGKRIRASLFFEFYRLLGGEPERVQNFAAAIEMIHTYSLIHDDLPCMDDDDFRRGKHSNHKVFGEDMALLAGDALLTQAFFEASRPVDGIPAERIITAINRLSYAAGMCKMVAGQVDDIRFEGKKITLYELEKLQSGKTVAMICVPAYMACALAGADEKTTEKCVKYCENIGRAFQIKDDILDVTSTTEALGKPVGSDDENGKNTYVSMLGLDKATALVNELSSAAVNEIRDLPGADTLCDFALALADRKK